MKRKWTHRPVIPCRILVALARVALPHTGARHPCRGLDGSGRSNELKDFGSPRSAWDPYSGGRHPCRGYDVSGRCKDLEDFAGPRSAWDQRSGGRDPCRGLYGFGRWWDLKDFGSPRNAWNQPSPWDKYAGVDRTS
jgi:hypothetical protein